MFTGIVEEVGRVASIEQSEDPGNITRLTVAAELVPGDMRLGDSIAVNGACLT
ncbi:MAG: riboflavin synthase, partial [Dehalococcoidia bacterium]|nr:riboflavin synthase [Dehalococcoidia bacterium]